MGRVTTITVEDGVATIVTGGVTVVTGDGKITLNADCGCSETPEVPCEAQSEWSRNQPVRFGFIPEVSGGVVMFSHAREVGSPTTEIPAGFLVIQNQGDGIFANFARSPDLTMIQSLAVSIVTEGEDSIEIDCQISGSVIAGYQEGPWKLEAGKSYCVTVTPTFNVE